MSTVTPDTSGARCASFPAFRVLPLRPEERSGDPAWNHAHVRPVAPGLITRATCNGALRVPTDSEPLSALLLHTADPHAALTLWLADSTGKPGDDLLTIKGDGRKVTGTGEEMEDIACAILRYTRALLALKGEA